ncbi:uncharacterized protein LOC105228148 [Bactrocera dorsalis]|uniref:Uncharacterized protein LOC105228148 n=1 Tax=Bactrocera dorsalis TaxID=27457 RepID=A0A6I9V421_BACDO|nr:uncharacterized protein LOC105228148 [Bactrocera dorsalis]
MGWFSFSILLAFLELVISFAALIAKKITDSQGEQVFKRNQKLSTEWSLLNNLNWSQAGNDFSIIVYGGYTFIAGVFLLSRIKANKFEMCEKTLLYCGTIFFVTQACLVFGTLEYIPDDIQINALVLGTLSVMGSLLFFIDICYNSSLKYVVSRAVQTETYCSLSNQLSSIQHKPPSSSHDLGRESAQKYFSGNEFYIKPLSINLKKCQTNNGIQNKNLKRVLQTDV